MKKFMIMHYGFEPPTPEVLEGWKAWFASIADRQLDQGGFAAGREISRDGTRELPFGPDSLTGYNVIEANDLDEAHRIAAECPFIGSTRVYEMRSH